MAKKKTEKKTPKKAPAKKAAKGDARARQHLEAALNLVEQSGVSAAKVCTGLKALIGACEK